VIEFGSSGYVMLYRHDELTDRVVILTVKHQKEAGYQNL
jgi:plasmid stabilization system protein ParE